MNQGVTAEHAHQDRLETLWLQANHDAPAEAAFLRELSHRSLLVILRQPPGSGDAAPGRNLVQWQRTIDGASFIPIFTGQSHFSLALPSPATLVSVPVRLLLAAGGTQRYIVNPLSKEAFELNTAQLALLRGYIADTHHDAEWPSRTAPWAFRLPDDALYPVAVKLVEWFNQSGRVDQAFLYELTRGKKRCTEIVLGINEPADQGLADALRAIAVEAGVTPATFLVRFLPDEPSHREGIALAKLMPFYQRP
ncbi:SseB family protein [Dyella acidiphila]|uniref:SseB family protein n=1 Tax=Dyella acidiphila TaxID=2775866 RepID=A0ABR9GG50_9GAMM|nr:SseB family protein [Dyella acidiphila]MBE1163031.1 SseB family protein [Dyella acidiphila]